MLRRQVLKCAMLSLVAMLLVSPCIQVAPQPQIFVDRAVPDEMAGTITITGEFTNETRERNMSCGAYRPNAMLGLRWLK
jgi:hypothetical protein